MVTKKDEQRRVAKPDWMLRFQEAFCSDTRNVAPLGWLTTTQIAKEFRVSRDVAIVRIRRMILAGEMQMQKFRTTSGQVTRPIPHYKLVE